MFELGSYSVWLGLLGMILITIPSIIVMFIHSILYLIGRKFRVETSIVDDFVDKKITVIMPIRKEPLEIVDDGLNHLHSLELGKHMEVIIVSDDPKDYLDSLKKLVSKWRDRGLDLYLVWRSESRGFKAGALNVALGLSTGDYVYVMDVDNRLSKEALLKAIGLIENEGYEAVVIRWYGGSRDTRVSEAIASSMDYIVDSIYRGRACLKLPLLTVGTGTLFKTSYLKSVVGGWDEERILEDIDIGVRIICLNGRVGFIDKPPIHVDVPRRLKSFLIQQERWAYGAVDVALSRFKDILFSKQPLYSKIELFVYLLQYTPVLFTLLGILFITPSIVYGDDLFYKYWFLVLPWAIVSAFYVYTFTDSQARRGYSRWRGVVNLGRISAITVVLSPCLSKAMLKAFFRRPFVFKRTPKGVMEARFSGLRFPYEIVLAIVLSIPALYGLCNGVLFTSSWILFYLLGYYYSIARWWRDLVYK